MATNDNLLNVSQNFFSPDIVQKISDLIGQSADKTKTGLKSVIPTLMSGIVDKGSTPEGAADLVNMVNTHNFESTTKPDVSKLSEGTDIVKNIFGSNLNNVVSKLGSTTGLAGASITKMLGLAAPMIMGVLGSKVKNEKLSSSGLMNFLSQQKSAISTLTAGATGVSGFSGLSSMAGGKTEVLQKSLSRTRGFPWKIVVIAALVLFGLWFWWLNARNKVQETITDVTIPVQTAAVKMVTPSVSELRSFMATGTLSELPKNFHFEKLTFETATTALVSGAEAELDSIASAMNEYPMSNVRLEGYTDNVGVEESNRVLSERRASAVKAELMARGIDGSRIETVGYGSQNPIADNATAEGRAQNRRIEFVVTKIK